MRRRKEDVTIELMIGIAICLGATIAVIKMPEDVTIQGGIIRLITTICIVLFILVAAYIAFHLTRIRLFKESKLPSIFQFPPAFNSPQRNKAKTREFLSPSEKEFKKYLRQNLPANIEIHCKVRLADILKSETNYRRIIMMHIDYVLIDEEAQNVLLAVELDDESHNTPEARERDAIKNNALEESGINLIRIPVSKKYHPAIITNIIDSLPIKTNRRPGTLHVPLPRR